MARVDCIVEIVGLEGDMAAAVAAVVVVYFAEMTKFVVLQYLERIEADNFDCWPDFVPRNHKVVGMGVDKTRVEVGLPEGVVVVEDSFVELVEAQIVEEVGNFVEELVHSEGHYRLDLQEMDVGDNRPY